MVKILPLQGSKSSPGLGWILIHYETLSWEYYAAVRNEGENFFAFGKDRKHRFHRSHYGRPLTKRNLEGYVRKMHARAKKQKE